MIAHTLIGPLLQIFFTDHLVAQRRLSLRTAATPSYLATCGSRRYARSIAWSHCVILRASA
jgi:hypothetical protein